MGTRARAAPCKTKSVERRLKAHQSPAIPFGTTVTV